MGIQHLWKLLEPARTSLPYAAFGGHILAVDVAVLVAAVRSAVQNQGRELTARELLQFLLPRLCRMLQEAIIPVIVLDGPVSNPLKLPVLRARRAARKKRSFRVPGKLRAIMSEAVQQQQRYAALSMDLPQHLRGDEPQTSGDDAFGDVEDDFFTSDEEPPQKRSQTEGLKPVVASFTFAPLESDSEPEETKVEECSPGRSSEEDVELPNPETKKSAQSSVSEDSPLEPWLATIASLVVSPPADATELACEGHIDIDGWVCALCSALGVQVLRAPRGIEAEGLAAQLCSSGLVKAVVTEDSDVFLAPHVTCLRLGRKRTHFDVYPARAVQMLGITPARVLAWAMMCGSDYFSGEAGIGPVKAASLLGSISSVQDVFRMARSDRVSPEATVQRKVDAVRELGRGCVFSDVRSANFTAGPVDVEAVEAMATRVGVSPAVVKQCLKMLRKERVAALSADFLEVRPDLDRVKSKGLRKALEALGR